jgi:uncharacterized protein YndB with AHSA1/START domain
MTATGELATSVHIDAPPEIVFPYFTDAEKIVRWLGTAATLDPVPGGVFAVDVGDSPARGSYVSIDPVRSVVFTWGMPGSDSLPPGGTTVEVTFTPMDGGTLVTLVHRGLSADHRRSHEDGWRSFLGKLTTAAAGGRQESLPAVRGHRE